MVLAAPRRRFRRDRHRVRRLPPWPRCIAIPFTFLLALLPAAAVILYAEPRGVRSPVAYALLGVLVAVVSVVGAVVVVDLVTYRPSYPARVTPPAEVIRQLALGCLLFVIPGLCGGLTYWAKAGRHAGGATVSV